MAKAEAGSPKALANRMKAKGLQKLKFYCQACEKQCRDENGFKCHIMSESHQRQMLLVAANPHKFVDNFTDTFRKEFLSLLSRRHGTKRVLANRVYQEYISDKQHIHMNSTKWNTLTEFCKELGREGVLRVDETERGLYISWVDTSPKALARQAAIQRMDRQRKDDEERELQLIKEQVEKASKSAEERGLSTTDQEASELKRVGEQPIKLALSLKPAAATTATAATTETKSPDNGPKMILGGLRKKMSLASLAKKSSAASSPSKPANSTSSSSMKFGNMTLKRKEPDASSVEPDNAKKLKA
ncbi:domain of Kin17 curved DNA-binding protein-domain-containing protein [Mycotypha africana]|uniref:domain of Kin17 curved DNA-binding protein-domain-containing protein n=1 Tax=Mycotypha africana TaxID=64632 RepID=UPI00230119B6|nr:domain of Kin17 curved DNA-binding protein-domain-containing protein [Mycotypha africana]KAI8973407.1 domain of Kin17 curved DNA-binding protein-domain-containing protein [Mycotypha africana]